jgi:DNA-binding transcriptional regulator YiaG
MARWKADMDIRRLRLKLGLTQEQLAVRVGVSFSTVNRWEKGRSRPSPLALKRLKAIIDRDDPDRESEVPE